MVRHLLPATPPSFTILSAISFLIFLLFFVSYAPLTFDEAFNATLALSLSHGMGYGSHLGGTYSGFNPYISTGFLFIAPFSLVLALVGPSIMSAHLYSLGVTFLFFVTALAYARKLHPWLPLAVIFLSVSFLDHGKTDLFDGPSVRSLPEPLYGLWFQFLGNMSGSWAAIACVLGCVSSSQATWRRLLSVFLWAVFSCNSKMVDFLPLASSLACIFLLAPKVTWSSTLSGGLGAFVGLKLNTWLAQAVLDTEAFSTHKQIAADFFRSNQRPYHDLMCEPSWSAVLALARNARTYWAPASHYISDTLMVVTGVLFAVSACLLFRYRRQGSNEMMLRLLIAFGVSSLVTIFWWAAIPGAPIRHLTAATPFVVVTLAVAVVGVLANSPIRLRAASSGILTMLFVVVLYQKLHAAYPYFSASIKARREQTEVSALVQQQPARKHNSTLCGDGWWYPHEISFLSNSPEMISCASDIQRQVVIPKHLFPQEVRNQRRSGMCNNSYSGSYYEVFLCGPWERG
jgi:hypothetical protein